jgi:hypothetical protein
MIEQVRKDTEQMTPHKRTRYALSAAAPSCLNSRYGVVRMLRARYVKSPEHTDTS